MPMNLIAIYNLPEEREALGEPLAKALGKTLYEANTRLRAPGPGPLVVAVFNEFQKANELKDRLDAAGFDAIKVSDDEVVPIQSRLSVKKISVHENGINAETREGNAVEIPYAGVRIILHAMGSQRSTTTETIKETKIDVGKAVMTGGLSFRKTTEHTIEHTEETREPFVIVLAPGKPALEFREAGLDYGFLGAELQPSRGANFSALITMLRQRCAGATYDNRLLQKPEQLKLLGPVLAAETYLDTALTVLAKVMWVTQANV